MQLAVPGLRMPCELCGLSQPCEVALGEHEWLSGATPLKRAPAQQGDKGTDAIAGRVSGSGPPSCLSAAAPTPQASTDVTHCSLRLSQAGGLPAAPPGL